ncbi:ATP-binding protein [Thiomicrospira cyclica]|uniref:ATPase n=1 Tax=Thiomicrospira cyclica (strain DSM 14477 / JCM 11371 / ALM1) TaxID=717773 RepID=F6DBT7_THICA|nr:ATP-binding protein [Thiomicrospira cyclica]AEG31323.1 ATPase [Thiomicrospira cyclica ALM1]
MKELLVEQNPHWSNPPKTYAYREAFSKLVSYLPLKQVITITGIRRCGKSTLAKMAIKHLIDEGMNPTNILFVNLEQPLFLEYRHDPSYLQKVLDTYLTLCNPIGRIVVIFDEIQFFDNWQVFIKSKYETADIKFIITGSNSSMLSSEINTLLTGRTLTIHLNTFSFSEFLHYKGIAHANEIERLNNRIQIAIAKQDYLQWGGFFEVMEIADPIIKKDLLNSYAKNIIYRDIVPRFKIRQAEVVERLFYYLLSQTTHVLNYTTLAQTFEMSDKSIKEYIGYFEDVFLFQRIDNFHNKPKERIKSMKKLYTLDNGFLQVAPKQSPGFGQALENLVFCYLCQRDPNLCYRKDQVEVDFYSQQTLYQVAYEIDNDKTRQRELNAFKHFRQTNEQCKLITFDSEPLAGLEDVEMLTIDQLLLDCN